MHRNRTGRAAVALSLTLLVSACGSSTKASDDATRHTPHGVASGSHTMADGTVMTDAEMNGAQPSPAARMVCSDEIAGAVQRTLDLAAPPTGRDTWRNRLYTCDYPIGAQTLRLSVKDLSDATQGRAWFDRLRHRLDGATAIRGLENLGLPAYETTTGDVVFLKDHKTLWVQAGDLSATSLPAGFTRTEVAYGVAAAVVGCWSE
ncbi:hypothetical protein [Nocardioides panaciterrulae]|uniref:DUF3558 domain-containing protein n=1 Tax=Nocardioides panaciterrulae TaxID=661492 RepID=A0A7Y9E7V9_9ACTN|nr:hypothetical protein [Nocardioides panaciterrulae]NYD42844.1 hypothetical protein [Nocardioides panaciterrulae]